MQQAFIKCSIFLSIAICVAGLNNNRIMAQKPATSANTERTVEVDDVLDAWKKRAAATKYIRFSVEGEVKIAKGTYTREDPMTDEVLGPPQPTQPMIRPWKRSLEFLPWSRRVNRDTLFVTFHVNKGQFQTDQQSMYFDGSVADYKEFDTRSKTEKQSTDAPFIEYRLEGKPRSVSADVFGVEYCILASYGHLIENAYSRIQIEQPLWAPSVNASVSLDEKSGLVVFRMDDGKTRGGSTWQTIYHCDPDLDFAVAKYQLEFSGKVALTVNLRNVLGPNGNPVPISGDFSKHGGQKNDVQFRAQFRVTNFETLPTEKTIKTRATPPGRAWCKHLPTRRVYQNIPKPKSNLLFLVGASAIVLLLLVVFYLRRRLGSN